MSYEICSIANSLKNNKYNTPMIVGVCTQCFSCGGLLHLNFSAGFF
jgi:hypothetical protein